MKSGLRHLLQVAGTCSDASDDINDHLSRVHAAIAAAAVDGTLGRVRVFNLAELGQRAVVAALIKYHHDGGDTAIILSNCGSKSARAVIKAIRKQVAKAVGVANKNVPLSPTETGKDFSEWFSALKTAIEEAGGTLVLPEINSPDAAPDRGAAASGGGSMN